MKAIQTTYHGPTGTRGSRITASDCDGNRVTVPYDHSLNSSDAHRAAAIALIRKMGWAGTYAQGGLGNTGEVFVPVYDGPGGTTFTVDMTPEEIGAIRDRQAAERRERFEAPGGYIEARS